MYYLKYVFPTVLIHGEKNIKKYGTNELIVNNPAQFPDPQIIEQ